MYKKIFFILVFFIYFFCFKLVNAEVTINEIQISPTDSRFIELYNSGNSTVDLTNYYIQRKTETGTDFGSLVSKTNFENKKIDAGGYFLISRSSMDNFDIILGSLTLTESNTIQIKNSNGEVVDKVGWGNCGESCVSDNPSEGKSIQKMSSGSWVVAIPTPRAENIYSEDDGNDNILNEDDDNGDEGESTIITNYFSSSKSNENKPKVVPVFKANILAPKLAFAGQPIEFDLSIKYGEDIYACGKYFWNFGDGVSMEKKEGFKKFTHTYFYPGEYNVSLEYYKSNGSFEPEVTDEMVVKVIPLTVSISKVGDYKDFFIELTNNADSKIDISNWILSSLNKNFILPKKTTIDGKKSLIIPGRISGFVLGDQYDLKLSMPTGEIVFDYNTKSVPIKKWEGNVNNQYKRISEEKEISNQNNLAASPILGTQKNSKNSYIFIIGLFAFLGISGGVIYLLRKKKYVISVGDDFDILDE